MRKRGLFFIVVVAFGLLCCYLVLRQKEKAAHKPLLVDNNTTATALAVADKPRIPAVHVMVMPSDVDPENRGRRLEAISSTWGKELLDTSDAGLTSRLSVVVSQQERDLYEKEVKGFGETFEVMVVPPELIDALHKNIYLGKVDMGPTYKQFMWAVQEVVRGDGLGHHDALDYLVVAVDLTFLIVPNLLCLIQKDAPRPKEKAFMGLSLRTEYSGGTDFISFAAGMVMTMSLARGVSHAYGHPEELVDAKHSALSPCRAQNPWEEINWAIPATSCLRSVAGAYPVNVYSKSKGHRFHAFGPVRTANGRLDDWFKGFHEAYHGQPPNAGVLCCASDTVSFHYVEGPECRFLHALLLDQAIYREMGPEERTEAWPKEISGYSAAPTLDDTATWRLLLDKIKRRKIRADGTCHWR